MNADFFTAEMLATFAGLVAAVSLVVQFTKPMLKKKLSDAWIRLYVWIISLILAFVFLQTGWDIRAISLTIVNSILIALTSMGIYENVSDPKALKHK